MFDVVEGCATGLDTPKLACGSGVVDVVDNACDAWFELSAFGGAACALGVIEGGRTWALGVLEEEDGMAFSELGCGRDVVL